MGAAWIAFYMQSSGWRSLRSASKAQTVTFALIEPPSYAREPVMAWHRQVRGADWATPADVKRAIRSASILKNGRVVFNIAGNKYRIVVWIQGRRCPTHGLRRSDLLKFGGIVGKAQLRTAYLSG
jgi:mRNA-degrading endonuclease HigB of HigAB toxin-antitoxin module